MDSIHDDYLQIRERIKKKLDGLPPDSEQAKFLQTELEVINQKLGLLQGLSQIYFQRYFFLSIQPLRVKRKVKNLFVSV